METFQLAAQYGLDLDRIACVASRVGTADASGASIPESELLAHSKLAAMSRMSNIVTENNLAAQPDPEKVALIDSCSWLFLSLRNQTEAVEQSVALVQRLFGT